jgi:cytochrome bd-type quinol oxidase subunit 2
MMETKHLLTLTLFLLVAGAVSSYSQDFFAARDLFNNIACNIICAIEYVILAVCALAAVLSGARYMSSDDPHVREDMRKNIKYAVVGIILVFAGIPAINAMVNQTRSPLSCSTCSPDAQVFKIAAETFSCRIICLVQLVAGSILALIVVLAGIRYIASGEDPAARHSMMDWIKNALIGMFIIALAVPVLNYISEGSAAPLNCDCAGAGAVLPDSGRTIMSVAPEPFVRLSHQSHYDELYKVPRIEDGQERKQ